MKLTKVTNDRGRQVYKVMQGTETGMNEKYLRILRDGFVAMDMAQNILVVKTVAGMAMAVAAALDAMKWPEDRELYRRGRYNHVCCPQRR